MTIKEMKLSDLKPYEKNPRKNDNAVGAVAKSIEQFGFKVPIVIDKNNVIVAGHTRYKAAQKLGLESVPCIVADDLTPAQIKAFRLADNKTAELSAWDFGNLSLELDDLKIFDMNDFGFVLSDAHDINNFFEVEKQEKSTDKPNDSFRNETSKQTETEVEESLSGNQTTSEEPELKKIICPHCGKEIEL